MAESPPRVDDERELIPGVVARPLDHGEGLHGVTVTLEPGATAATHGHPHEQLTAVIAGAVVLTVDGADYRLGVGEALVIPGETTHSATNEGVEPATVIDVFRPPREELLE